MRVTGLHLYPVKSLGGAEVESAVVEPWGLAGDRRWALVDDAGDPVTARECHALLRLTATVVDDDTIRILDRRPTARASSSTPRSGSGPCRSGSPACRSRRPPTPTSATG